MPPDSGPRQAVPAVGRWSAILCTVFSLAYVIAQLAEWVGWLGSAGGALWAVTFPAASWLLAVHFGRLRAH